MGGGREWARTGMRIHDEQMDGVGTDIEDSEAHDQTLAGVIRLALPLGLLAIDK